ncbi:helix-turn-helix transcriptional regulator [Hoyosella altamirensis]|uniref:Putative DNA-binding transcriptional regulator YafY n=1 Tax=Hoyosella altamirensis TaxID=616997 RepID=A0A839RJV3_9ACTN|nr:YafY family protein [Hoyosella altamirensis]MBB3036730.1 putative DNA-binding transcriptional regulator YafY [Hoyosella altamirensis]
MANTSGRMLRLLSLLQNHRFWPGEELSGRLEVSPRTLRRDIDRLRELGYPVDATRGVAGGYQLRSGSALPPLLLDDDEAVAIAVGLRSAAAGSIGETGDQVTIRALTKIIQVMPPRLRKRVAALQDYTVPVAARHVAAVDAVTLTIIAQCCRDSERLTFTHTKTGGESAERRVEPHRLVSLGQRWYLVAWDLDRCDWRSFRVDRVTGPAPTGVRFRSRELPAADAAEFVQRGLSTLSQQHRIDVEIQAPAEQIRRIAGHWATITPSGETTCVMTMTVDDLGWPALILAAAGAEFRVKAPTALVHYLRDTAALFGRATDGSVA